MRKSKLVADFDSKRLDCDNENIDLCDSMQCICGKSIIRNFYNQCLDKYFEQKEEYFFITICRSMDKFQKGSLSDFNIKNSKQSLAKTLKSLNIPNFKCLGYIDIQLTSYFNYANGRFESWDIHYHMVASTSLSAEMLKKAIYSAFNSADCAKTAKIQTVIARPFSKTYIVKHFHEITARYQEGIRGQTKRRQTIKGKPKTELLEWFKTQNPLEWIFLIGLRRSSNRLIDIESKTRDQQGHRNL